MKKQIHQHEDGARITSFGFSLIKIIRILCLFAFTPLLHSLANADEQTKFVHVKGTEIIAPDGKPLALKGINLGNWLNPEGYMFKFEKTASPRMIDLAIRQLVGPTKAKEFWQTYLDSYITRDDIAYIKKLGFNHVRVPFNYRMFTDDDYLAGGKPGFEYLDRVVKWCKHEGLWVLLDMHAAPGGQTGTNIDDSYGYPFLFIDEKSKLETIALWRDIAAHYKDEPAVLGYDLLNEPISIEFYKDHKKLNAELEPLYKRISLAIREVDKDHLLFLGGAQANYNFDVFQKPFDTKVVYEFHKYSMDKDVTVVRVPKFEEYLQFREKYQVPIYLGESGEEDDVWIDDYRKLIEKQNIGWCFWTYKKMDDNRCVATFDRPKNYELLVNFIERSQGFFDTTAQERPSFEALEITLREFTTNSKFDNCRKNHGFIRALSFESKR